MSNAHKCNLPFKDNTGLKPLPPNASLYKHLVRNIRRLIIVNPENFKSTIFFHNKSAILTERRRHINSRYCYIIHPFSTLSSIHQIAFFFIWTFKMLIDPMINNLKPAGSIINQINNYVVVKLQCVLIISLFFMGYVDAVAGEVVFQHLRVIKRYAMTFLPFDLMAVEIHQLVLLTVDRNPSWRVNEVINYLHVVGVYARLRTILNYLNDIGKMLKMSRKVRKCINYLLKTYMYVHFSCCTLYFVARVVYQHEWPNDSWMVMAKIHPAENAPFLRIYQECFLMAMCFFFGASSNQYNVEQTNEQICLSIITICGRLYTLFLLADVLRMFGVVEVSESGYERRLAQMREYMTSYNLPPNLKSKMVKYYQYKLQKRYFNEKEILNSLSDNLRSEVFLFSARTLIQRSEVFKYLPQREVATLISLMRQETFAAGNVIYSPDHPIEDIYFISTGSVMIQDRDGRELFHLEDGEAIGIVQKMYGEFNYYCVVLETTEMFIINSDDLFQFLKPFTDALAYIRVIVAQRHAVCNKIESMTKKEDQGGCIVDLRNGKLLERKRKRKTIDN